jgi:hypothetical protein
VCCAQSPIIPCTDRFTVLVDILTDMDNSTSNGLIGLGPPQSSNIFQQDSKGSSSAGDPPLDRILAANTSLPPLLTILLDRTNSSAVSTSGAMTVGEVQPGYEAVLNQPRLPIPNGSHHWLTQLDPNGIVGPNGHPLDFNIVRGAVNGSLPVIFDSGFTVPQIPAELAALLYAQVRDAAWDARLGSWTVPCNTPFNITWRFGGVDYPIHPLDSNLSNMTDDPNVCIGGVSSSWQFAVSRRLRLWAPVPAHQPRAHRRQYLHDRRHGLSCVFL